MSYRSGYIGFIGPTNAGKSTLLNRLLGDKIAIVSPKPQTTRHCIKGILTETDSQLIFCDTPGLHQSAQVLNREMLKVTADALRGMDIVCLVLDATAPDWQWLSIFGKLREGQKKFIVLNKEDIAHPLPQGEEKVPIFLTSATTGKGCGELLAWLKKQVPEGPAHYSDDIITDQSMRFLVSELVREQCLLFLEQEIPYGITVLVDSFKEEAILKIHASIVVNRETHKGIVIGKGGATLRKIGEQARLKLEQIFGQRLFLKLFVRVEKNWTKDERKVKEFVYGQP